MSVIPYQEPQLRKAPQDRRGILLGFGVVLIGIGSIIGFIGVMTALSFLAGAMPTTGRGGRVTAPARPGSIAASAQPLLWFGGIATVMIWTGVASVRLKRWSRAVVLSISGTLIGIGLVTLMIMAVLYAVGPIAPPATVRVPTGSGGFAPVSAASGDALILFVVCLIVVFLVIVPGVFFLAYRGGDVQRTLDEADPRLGWADRCPLPVLTLALIFIYLSFTFSLNLFAATSNSAAPTRVPGVPLTDVGAVVLIVQVVLSVLCAWVAWLLYRKSAAGPWMALAMIALFAAAALGVLATPAGLNDPVLTALGGTVPASDLQWETQVMSVRSMIVVGGFALAATIFTLYCRRQISETTGVTANTR